MNTWADVKPRTPKKASQGGMTRIWAIRMKDGALDGFIYPRKAENTLDPGERWVRLVLHDPDAERLIREAIAMEREFQKMGSCNPTKFSKAVSRLEAGRAKR